MWSSKERMTKGMGQSLFRLLLRRAWHDQSRALEDSGGRHRDIAERSVLVFGWHLQVKASPSFPPSPAVASNDTCNFN